MNIVHCVNDSTIIYYSLVILINLSVKMTDFTCDKCNKTFASKRNMKYHIKNKVCERQGRYVCDKCNKELSSSSSLYRHKTKACKKQSTDEDQKAELLKLIEDMQEQINHLSHNNDSNQVITNKTVNNGNVYQNTGDVNNTINNITVNVVPFGKEDLSKIDKNDLLQVFRSGFNSALRLTETTHFNPKYPEYHNVYISNMKNKYAMTYDGDDWALVMKDELIDKMYDNKRDYIEENMDEFLNSLLPSQINALHRWLNVDDDHQYVQKVKNEMKLMLYNKRKMVLDPKPPQVSDIDEIDYTVRVIKEPKHNASEPKVIKASRIASRNGKYRKAITRR